MKKLCGYLVLVVVVDLDSNYIKASLFCYFRFKRGIKHIASECGTFNADILFRNKRYLTEIEIKTSKSDFMQDFKKPKHEFYLNNSPSRDMLTRQLNEYSVPETVIKHDYYALKPNQFMFAVPVDILSWCYDHLKDSPYGLIGVFDGNIGENLIIETKPKLLHKKTITHTAINQITSRMSSELANFWTQKVL